MTRTAAERSAQARRAVLTRNAVLSVTAPDQLRAWGQRGMGPTPAARTARAVHLQALSAAERSRATAARCGDEPARRRAVSAKRRAKTALQRYDAAIAAAQREAGR